MKNRMKKLMAMFLAGVMGVSVFTGCGSMEDDTDDLDNNTEGEYYTLRESVENSPSHWNPHTWETQEDSVFQGLCELGLVDIGIGEDGAGYEWIYEMASDIRDVTEEFPEKEKFGIGSGETGRVYQIDLNKDACWEDGTGINADTYIYSMWQMLDPKMKNRQADKYINGGCALANALDYYNNDKAGTPVYLPVWNSDSGEYALSVYDTDKMYASMSEAVSLSGMSLSDAYQLNAERFLDEDGNDMYIRLASLIKNKEFTPVNDEICDIFRKLAINFDFDDDRAFMGFCFLDSGETYAETEWDEVGLVKKGDYQLLYITASPVSRFSFLMSMTSNWLVNQELYEDGKQTEDGRVVTDYGTSQETYMSYGPYRLVSFEEDSRFILEKNEAWYGWTDGKHRGQYQADRIVYDIISDYAAALQQFNAGKLDRIALKPDDIDAYRLSDFLVKEEQTSTLRFVFATDLEVLDSLETEAGDGANKKVLAYRDFRKALSLAIDRTGFCGQGTAAYEPAFALVNGLYYSDIEGAALYRNSKEAKKAILNLYGIDYTDDTIDEKYGAVTGYDVEMAGALFQAVYEQAIDDGNYTEGQEVHINAMVSADGELSAHEKKQEALLNRYVAQAAKNTGFEGKIKITFLCGSENRYVDVAEGNIEMISAAGDGEAADPCQLMLAYTDPDYMGSMESIAESCGWDPTTEELEISWDFDGDGKEETKSDTFRNWTQAICSGIYAGDADACLTILAHLEAGILDTYQSIPYAAVTAAGLHSQKIDYAVYDYNILYGFGGIRLLKFNYTDEEWKDYVNSGNLSYE